jgi:hypothetical protein
MKKSSFVLITLATLLIVGFDTEFNKTKECDITQVNGTDAYWAEYLGHDQTVDFWPDKFVNYWAVVVNKNDFPNVGFKIQGEFPEARYFSYNVYGEDRNSTASIFDTQIKAKNCSANPFKNQEKETSADKNLYTLFVVPESVSEFDMNDNVLKFIDGEEEIGLMLRYYVPAGGDRAGVDLPKIEVFDLDSKESVTIPETSNLLMVTPQILGRINAAYSFQIDNNVRFYRGDPTGLYPNNDNQYVRTFLNYDDDDVYVIRWKAPIFPKNSSEFESAEVRYSSMNLGDNITNNFDGIYDTQYKLDNDGFVTLVIADETPELREKAETAGYNFMPWTLPGNKGYLIYRNLLTKEGTTAAYTLNKVPMPSFGTNRSHVITHDAKNYIGAYAPTGLRMTKAEYLADFGGFNHKFQE